MKTPESKQAQVLGSCRPTKWRKAWQKSPAAIILHTPNNSHKHHSKNHSYTFKIKQNSKVNSLFMFCFLQFNLS